MIIDSYEGIHGGYGFTVKNRKGDKILEFWSSMDMFRERVIRREKVI